MKLMNVVMCFELCWFGRYSVVIIVCVEFGVMLY